MFPKILPRGACFGMLSAAAALAAAMIPTNAVAASRLFVSPAAPTDWMRDYTPAQLRQSAAARLPIDPASFDEPLLAGAIFQETNQQRADLHLPAFLPDEKASRAGLLHARWMARTHTLAHDETTGGGTPVTSLDRLLQQGLQPHVTAENIAFNLLPDITPGRLFYTRLVNGRPVYSYRPGGPALRVHTYGEFARVIVAQWMHSPGHRAHIVDPKYLFLGVGAALSHRRGTPDTIYGAQEFFTPHVPASTHLFGHGAATLLTPRL